MRATPFARVAAAALLCLPLWLAPGCRSDAEKAADLIAQADTHRDAGERVEEIQYLRQALKLQPDSAQVNLRIAEALRSLGKMADAAFFYGEAYRLDKSQTEAALVQASVLSQSDPAAAEAVIRDVLEREPDNAMAYVRLAELALVRSDSEGALEPALTAVQLAPDDARTYRVVGTVYRARIRAARLRGKPADEETGRKAIAAFEKAAALPDGNWFDYREIAYTCGELGERDAAKENWHKAWEAASATKDAAGMRAVPLGAARYGDATGDLDFVHWALEQRLSFEPDSFATLSRLANLEERAGRSPVAVWEKALKESPDSPELYVGLAQERWNSGERDAALSFLEGAPEAIAKDPRVRAYLVESYLQLQRRDDASRLVNVMRSESPEDPATRLSGARLDMASGNVSQAAETLRKLSVDVERVDVFTLLAVAENAVGDPKAALAAANRAFDLAPVKRPGMYRLRAMLMRRNEDWQGVISTLGDLRRASRRRLNAGDRAMLAQAQFETGSEERALKVLEPMLKRDEPPTTAILVYVRYMGRREPARARKLLESALKASPDDPTLLMATIQLDAVDGKPEVALARLEHRKQLQPGLLVARGRLFAAVGRYPEAEADARTALGLPTPPPTAAGLLITALEGQGRGADAAPVLEAARASGKLGGPELWSLGHLYIELGDNSRAVEVLDEAVAKPGAPVAAKNDLAYVLVETNGDLDRALELARQARAAMNQSPQVADTLGYVYLHKGMYEPAAAEFRSATEMAKSRGGSTAEYRYHLGLALEGQGRTDEALAALDAALEENPKHEKARAARAKLAATQAAKGAGS